MSECCIDVSAIPLWVIGGLNIEADNDCWHLISFSSQKKDESGYFVHEYNIK